jgi:hypothetical protein
VGGDEYVVRWCYLYNFYVLGVLPMDIYGCFVNMSVLFVRVWVCLASHATMVTRMNAVEM